MKTVFQACIITIMFLAITPHLQMASAQGPTPESFPFPGYMSYSQREQTGKRFTFVCIGRDKAPGGYIVGANLYGTDVYTEDSGVCAAAAHVGAISFDAGGTVTVEIRPGQSEYKGSTRNGVTSANWTLGSAHSFVIIGAGPIVPTAAAQTPPSAQSSCDWTGTWKRGDEIFTLVQIIGLPFGQARAMQLTGTGISDPSWRLTGTVAGNVLTGKWSNSKDSGSVRITLNADCNSFESSWGLGDNFTSFTGHGVRVTSSTQPTGMTIQAPKRQVIVGDLVLVPISLIKASNIANLNFQIKYDANIVKPEGTLSKGNLLENSLFSVNSNQSGNILSGFAQTTGLSGTGTVLNIPFRAVGKPGDRTKLDITVTTINEPGGAAPKIDLIAGEILIYNKDGTFPPPPGGAPPGSPPPPNITLGDCDGDALLTEVDALCALEMSVQLRPPQSIVDMDKSGDVTSRDAVLILQRAINK